MKLGAHVSTSGGIETSIGRGVDIGCEAIQIFGSAPQRWAFKRAPDEKIAAFKEKREGSGIDSVFFHCIYLINLGTPKPQNVKMGIKSLKNYMDLAHEIGADGIIFHPGSHMGRGYDAILKQTVESIIDVLEDSPEGPWLTLENTAGMGRHIGSKFEELGQIIHTVGSPRLKVCLDTEHSFAAGYDVATKDGLEAAMDEFDREDWAWTGWWPSTPTTRSSRWGRESTGTKTSVRGTSAWKGSRISWDIRRLRTCPSSWRCRAWRAAGRTGRTWTY